MRRHLLLRTGLAAAAAFTVAVWVASCGEHRDVRSAATANPVGRDQAASAGEFVGNAACADCHRAEFKAHRGGRHDLSLRFADRISLATQSLPLGQVKGTDYQFEVVGDRYAFGLKDLGVRPLDLAFGSGKSGIAFTVVAGPSAMAEARMSYYPAGKRYYVTPGQQGLPDRSMGNVSVGQAARQCFACHTISMPANSLMPEKRFLGVGCESCHGPGAAHVQAMRVGDITNLHMEHLGGLGGRQVNTLCGRCHRTAEDVAAKNLSGKHTDLFQAHGLSQSRCFRESGDRLTCLTCHDPHRDVSTDQKQYDTACLRCHGANTAASARLMKAKPCPVNRGSKCIACHMPNRPEPLFPGHGRTVADHYIRVIRRDARN